MSLRLRTDLSIIVQMINQRTDNNVDSSAFVKLVVIDPVGALICMHVAVHNQIRRVLIEQWLNSKAVALILHVVGCVGGVPRCMEDHDEPGSDGAVHGSQVGLQPPAYMM